jgi:hypothetical protein
MVESLSSGLNLQEHSISRKHIFGQEAEVDWFDAQANHSGDEQGFHVFRMWSIASGVAFRQAYSRASQQAFLEAHELAFAWFGGVFNKVRYRRKAILKKLARGRRCKQTERFIAFCSHWGFNPHFCRADEPDATGKPVDDPEPPAWVMHLERKHLRPLPKRPFELAEISFPVVDSSGCVRVGMNRYPTPLEPRMQAEAKIHPKYIEIWHNGQKVARHERRFVAIPSL